MSTAAMWMLIVSIIGGVFAIILGLWAALNKHRGVAFVSGVATLVTTMICGLCWQVLPHDHDAAKVVRQEYRERVWSEYKKCFDTCQQACHTQAEKTLDYTKERSK